MISSLKNKIFPFLKWFPFQISTLKADIIAGITVALILVPQSMAYAQLAGLPAHYGLYASFLPVIIAALWGSSAHLSTGPVAVVALLSASSLSTLAVAGSDAYIAYAIVLAFLVGVTQIVLGTLKMGVIINFLSHPVIIGFTNAAAIIIGLSQLQKLFRLSVPQTEHFLYDIWQMILQLGDTHLPTLAFGVSAFAIMWILKKYFPKMPGVLIAVIITTLVSWGIGFEQKITLPTTLLPTDTLQTIAQEHKNTLAQIQALDEKSVQIRNEMKVLEKTPNTELMLIQKKAEKESIDFQKEMLTQVSREQLKNAKKTKLRIAENQTTKEKIILTENSPVPAGFTASSHVFIVKAITTKDEVKLIGGGNVVGSIPAGLPSFALPPLSFDAISSLMVTAIIISLVAFMEAISIAKSIASKTKDPIDANQELIGQGLGNIASSFSFGFPVSGSFSRSAVNFNAGAKTGFSSLVVGVVVLITLLFLTPLLYHLPEAVLAAVIMMAVIGLVNFKEIFHIWKTDRNDGIAAITTFVSTLIFAPHLDNGIIIGAILAIVLYLVRSSSTRVYEYVPDHEKEKNKFVPLVSEKQKQCPQLQILRIEGTVFFGAVAHVETMLKKLDTESNYRLIIANNITFIDAAGAELLVEEAHRLQKKGGKLFFCGIKPDVYKTLQNGHFIEEIGQENIFASKSDALRAIVPLLDKKICKGCTTRIFHECPTQ